MVPGRASPYFKQAPKSVICIITFWIGMAIAIVGGFIENLPGLGSVIGFNTVSFGLAIAGAVLFLLIYRLIKKSIEMLIFSGMRLLPRQRRIAKSIPTVRVLEDWHICIHLR